MSKNQTKLFRITSIEEGKNDPDKVTSLDLSNKDIEEIDLDILLFNNLQELILDGNKNLKAIPEELEYMPELQRLSIRGCSYLLLNQLGNIPSLTALDCSEMDLGYVYGEESRIMCIGKYNKLKELIIENAKLSSIPSGISNLIYIEVMSFNNNCLEELPKEFNLLSSLRSLSVKNNKLKSLGKIAELPNLKILMAYGNKLKSEISKIKKKCSQNADFQTDLLDNIGNEGADAADKAASLSDKVTKQLERLGVKKKGKAITEDRFITLFEEQEDCEEECIPASIAQLLWGYDWNSVNLEWTEEAMYDMEDDMNEDERRVSISTGYYMNESSYYNGEPYLAIGSYDWLCYRTLLINLKDPNPDNPIVYEYNEELSPCVELSRYLELLQKKGE